MIENDGTESTEQSDQKKDLNFGVINGSKAKFSVKSK